MLFQNLVENISQQMAPEESLTVGTGSDVDACSVSDRLPAACFTFNDHFSCPTLLHSAPAGSPQSRRTC